VRKFIAVALLSVLVVTTTAAKESGSLSPHSHTASLPLYVVVTPGIVDWAPTDVVMLASFSDPQVGQDGGAIVFRATICGISEPYNGITYTIPCQPSQAVGSALPSDVLLDCKAGTVTFTFPSTGGLFEVAYEPALPGWTTAGGLNFQHQSFTFAVTTDWQRKDLCKLDKRSATGNLELAQWVEALNAILAG
jgi:hypothetical protein